MKSYRGLTIDWKRLVVAAAFVAGVMPGVASAETCTSGANGMITGVLTETMESAPAHAAPGGTGPLAAGSYPPGQGVRLAQATEKGTLGFGACGSLESLAGPITVHAQSTIMYATDADGNPVINPVSGAPDLLSGPINGVFKVETATGNVSGTLDGTLDFKVLCPGQPACPLVSASGTWTTKGENQTSGSFTGVAFVPFEIDASGKPSPGSGFWVYYDVTGGLLGTPIPGTPFVALTTDDFDQHGAPVAKFVITLVQ
jgi:hypothetical protein